ncbi:MAG: hypothetical protein IT522_13520 [Burkholderiales bacterium]|nr:hypothetical protein [Burkholderiales bacterium]
MTAFAVHPAGATDPATERAPIVTAAATPAAALPVALRPARAFGPEVAPGTPQGGYVGRVTLTPAHAPAGATIVVRASGLPPRQPFDLVWTTVEGRWKAADGEYKGREYRPVAYRVATLTSDERGDVAASFVVPEDFGFSHDVLLQQGARLFTKAGFDVDMTVEVSPKQGPPGTPITVDVKGIGRRHMENSWLLLYDNRFTGWMSAVTTEGSARFTIPAAGAPGVHVLEMLHGDFTFPYRNMQQSPVPDRPQFVREFTVTAGAAVLPPPADRQVLAAPRLPAAHGTLVTTPAFSVVGEPLRIESRGLTPGKTYDVTWQTVSGNRVGGSGWEERTRSLGQARADAAGAFVLALSTPDDLGGAHAIAVTDGTTTHRGAHWILPSAAPLDVARGPAGTRFRIHLKGVGWTETANIYTVVYDNAYIGYGCGFNSQGDAEFTLYASGPPGWHFIDLYPAIYKGTEARPLNFRIPQLTYARDHPGEDLPAFRFAFEVVEDAQ